MHASDVIERCPVPRISERSQLSQLRHFSRLQTSWSDHEVTIPIVIEEKEIFAFNGLANGDWTVKADAEMTDHSPSESHLTA